MLHMQIFEAANGFETNLLLFVCQVTGSEGKAPNFPRIFRGAQTLPQDSSFGEGYC